MIIQSDVTAFASELSVLSVGAWTDILAYVNEIDLTALGETAQTARMAQIYLAAHIGTMARLAGRGAAGPVTSESASALRRTYGLLQQWASNTWASNTSLTSTRYGQLYSDLLGTSLADSPLVI